MYEKIFTKGKINGCVTRNRVILSPMDDSLGQATGEISSRAIEYYAAKAKGGCGLVIVGYVAVCGPELSGISITGQAHLRTLADRHAMGNLAERIHEYGGKVFCQLNHPGRKTTAKYNEGHEPVSSSAMPPQLAGKFPPARELTVEEIKEIEECFANAAEHAFLAGVDGVEIHCAHYYLMNQFISPVRNVRTDEYGGSMENRCRIIVETIQAIRKRVPSSFPITLRLHAFDGEGFEGESTIDDMIEISKYLEANGVDAIHYSLGSADRTGCPEMEAGWRNDFYKRFKKELDIPIYGPNEVKTPDEAEKFLEEGVYDFVVMGRQQSADPDWCNKAKAGQPQNIRPCISCNYCVHHVTADEAQIRCIVNPLLGREIDNLEPLKKGEGTIIVIGAGPAGIQAALTASERGFKVILCDKRSELGGSLNLANKAPKKFRIDNLIRYYTIQIEQDRNIEVRLNYEITLEKLDELASMKPYAVVLASGGKSIVPRVPGGEKGISSSDVLDGKVKLTGKKVAVIGGGMTGLETASRLAVDGSKVTIIEMLPIVGNGIYYYNVLKTKQHLAEYSTVLKTSTTLQEIKDHSIVVAPYHGALRGSALTGMQNVAGIVDVGETDKHDGPYEIECDAVVLAIGVLPDLKILSELEARFDNVVTLGDCIKPGKIGDATSAAYFAMKNI